jgi:hypothetical protein
MVLLAGPATKPMVEAATSQRHGLESSSKLDAAGGGVVGALTCPAMMMGKPWLWCVVVLKRPTHRCARFAARRLLPSAVESKKE